MKPTYAGTRTTPRPHDATPRRRAVRAALVVSGAILFVELVGRVLTLPTSGLVLAAILLVVTAAILVAALPLLALVPESPRPLTTTPDPRPVRQLTLR